MEPSHIIILTLYLGVLGHLAGSALDLRALQIVTKPVASAAFIAFALHSNCLGTPAGVVYLAALVMSFLGDVFLISRSLTMFRAGLISFLLGHVLFILAFMITGIDKQQTLVGLIGMVPVSLLISKWILPQTPKNMKAKVLAYIIVITLMVAFSFGTGNMFVTKAAVLFYISDITVARDRFVQKSILNTILGSPMYFTAQLMFAAASGGAI